MIYIQKYRQLNPDKSYVLVDFDRTITTGDSSTTWGLLEESTFVDSNYRRESINLYNQYRPLEINPTIPFNEKAVHMEDWFHQAARLLNKYHIFKSTIELIIQSSNGLKLRRGVKPFLSSMRMLGVPVVIVSAGVGDFIEGYLKKQQCLFDNITIHSNYLIYDGDYIIGVKQPLIHSLNKGMIEYPEIQGRTEGILFGDQLEDIEMGRGLSPLTVGFVNSRENNIRNFQFYFDVVLTGDSSFEDVAKVYIKDYPSQRYYDKKMSLF